MISRFRIIVSQKNRTIIFLSKIIFRKSLQMEKIKQYFFLLFQNFPPKIFFLNLFYLFNHLHPPTQNKKPEKLLIIQRALFAFFISLISDNMPIVTIAGLLINSAPKQIFTSSKQIFTSPKIRIMYPFHPKLALSPKNPKYLYKTIGLTTTDTKPQNFITTHSK
ncbi:TPA: hypothetical protein DIC40_01040 [Patescibacteria group bacterium]|nr:hypothetical protein [Candidatus Gracilibacteria bacterium]